LYYNKMALKDWKLIGKNLGMNGNVTEWHNDKTREFITTRRGWNTITIWTSGGSKTKDIKCKTESAKLKIAKSYMRTH